MNHFCCKALLGVWDSTTGREVATLEGHGGIAHSCSWSPDGTRLAFASDDTTVRVWDVTHGREVVKLTGHTDTVESCTWSPDGTRLSSTSDDGTVRVLDPSHLHIFSSARSTVFNRTSDLHPLLLCVFRLVSSHSAATTPSTAGAHLGQHLVARGGHAAGSRGRRVDVRVQPRRQPDRLGVERQDGHRVEPQHRARAGPPGGARRRRLRVHVEPRRHAARHRVARPHGGEVQADSKKPELKARLVSALETNV
jgi:dipeptidyl aminopeptidase/acylaminoacyl peptidase